MSSGKIIYTGGNGLLGSEFKKIRPDINYTDYEDFNVLDYDQMKNYVKGIGCELIDHPRLQGDTELGRAGLDQGLPFT